MLASGIPPKFPIPWGYAAGSTNIRAIPTTSQIGIQAGAASLTDGYPPLNMVPIAAGGVPPFGQDMNGILKQITQWNQWAQAGGPIRYDGTFVAAIGGYTAGALLLSTSGHAIYESLVDNNTSDPNAGSTSWKVLSCIWSASTITATGSANAQIISLSPAPTSLSQLIGIPLWINSAGLNTGSVVINPSGLGGVGVLNSGGIPIAPGQLATGYPFCVVYNGVTFTLATRNEVFNDQSGNGGVRIVGSSTNGAGLHLAGNGNTTPNKTIRVRAGALEITNSANTAILATLDDIGNLTTGAHLRAGQGALGSGDNTVATTLADFGYSPAGSNAVVSWPNSTRILVFSASIPGGAGTTNITFPSFFATQCNSVMVCFSGNTPPGIAGSLSAAVLNVTGCSVTSSFASGGPWGVTIWALGS